MTRGRPPVDRCPKCGALPCHQTKTPNTGNKQHMPKLTDIPKASDQNLPLRERLEGLLNEEGAESGSNTPDAILSRFLVQCLNAFDAAVTDREHWYSRPIPADPPHDPGEPMTRQTAHSVHAGPKTAKA